MIVGILLANGFLHAEVGRRLVLDVGIVLDEAFKFVKTDLLTVVRTQVLEQVENRGSHNGFCVYALFHLGNTIFNHCLKLLCWII